MTEYYNNNAPIINQADARTGYAINWEEEEETYIIPSRYMSDEKCVTNEIYSEGMVSTTYIHEPGNCCKIEPHS